MCKDLEMTVRRACRCIRNSWMNLGTLIWLVCRLLWRWGSALKDKTDLGGEQKPNHKEHYISC